MSDVKKLLLETIKPSLAELSKKGIGSWSMMNDEWDDGEYCYECHGYGDDYFINDDGELECRCSECPFNPSRCDDD